MPDNQLFVRHYCFKKSFLRINKKNLHLPEIIPD